ncbi:MAG: hypothetical protein HY823_00370 [Acidobacteria bacterium]|nr:hypothetical protein [Acidobacteriota bacterium]
MGLLCTAGAQASPPSPAALQTWTAGAGVAEDSRGAGEAPLAVGSLQKPFVAQAWAAAHPEEDPPRFVCAPGPGCWNRAGHGEVGLVRALSLSCNAYFRNLAAATPPARLQAAFSEAGFIGTPRSPDQAIGLEQGEGSPVIRPKDLLAAYLRLVRRPWPLGERIREQVLAGLRDAVWKGTASGLGRQGGWAKTGTVPSGPLHTCGLALFVDDAGSAVLGRLDPGTGRGAALRLASLSHTSALEGEQPSGDASVTLRLLDLFRGRRIFLRNLGESPVPTGDGFLGPGSRIEIKPGQWAGPGDLELLEPRSGLARQVRGRVLGRNGPDGRLSILLVSSLQDYVAGVLSAELTGPDHPLRIELGAAILRFLAAGPRHPDADVCDATHCAWFVGRGAPPRWPAPGVFRRGSSPGASLDLAGRDWLDMQALARRPGPSQWTSHCGGRSLSGRQVWGAGDPAVHLCPRHQGGQTRPWERTWTLQEAEKAFGSPIDSILVGMDHERWVLLARGPKGTRAFDYDDAHRRLAAAGGWGALPSPADTVERTEQGFRVRGVGLGHRVGLCLGD